MPESDATASALLAYLSTPSPYNEVDTRESLLDGWYDVEFNKLVATLDQNGLLFVKGELDVLAPENAKGRKHFENLYIGTHADPLAALPDTRKNAPGDRTLVLVAKFTDVPANAQNPAAFHAALLHKPFTARIALGKKNKDGKQYTNIQRVVKLGAIPAAIDGTRTVTEAAPAAEASAVVAGAKFE